MVFQASPEFRDAAKRCSDIVRLHIAMGEAGRWIAVRLSDGGYDGVVYDTRRDAVVHQLHESLCAYVKIPHDDMPPEDAASYLAFNRKVYDAGYRMTDPDGPAVIVPNRREDMVRALRGDLRGVKVGRHVN